MGIFGALTTAVSGMRAQSYALENISGNIANSQTIAFKRVDTSFEDLIPDNLPSKQLSGNVVASSRSTNSVQGDIQNSQVGTYMAINGQGFFVVAKPSSFVDNRPVFDGVDLYTRRGDFAPDKNGYLVNSAGYYLMGIPVDPTTGNLVGSVPTLLQFDSGFLPAQATTQVEYKANLASYPLTPDSDPNLPMSELLQPANFQANPVAGPPSPATITGIGATLLPDAPALVTGTQDISTLSSVGGTLRIGTTDIIITAGMNAAAVEAAIDAETGTTGVGASIVSNRLRLTSINPDTSIQIGGTSTAAVLNELGLSVGTSNPTNLLTQSAVTATQTLEIQSGANPPNPLLVITFGYGVGQVSTLSELATELGTLTAGTASVITTGANAGNITIVAGGMSPDDTITIGGNVNPVTFGIRTTSAVPSNGTVIANDLTTFVKQSIGGGAITAYDTAGSPVNIQLRWAKVDSKLYGGTDTWNLFYQIDSQATGIEPAWQNVGINYTFGPNGQMSPLVATLSLPNVTVDGVLLGTVNLVHGAGGITQFSDPNGNVQVNLLQQNGYAAGTLQSVSVNDKGRVVGTYSNSRTIDLAEITLASFNGTNGLKRIDGGAFIATDASGTPTYGAPGKIVGSSLESSNTDIADEFTKLIVTQQAYSANTRVISTSSQMVQDLLNMLR
ncbi:MAG: flagellar hook-basal body complex protein [Alphaproteobacteria bacterium]|nr:flagellar hook-basal body complex protein [Alphaproteobacteria bacterium]